MGMGRRWRPKQTSMWVATQDLPRTAAHPFYTRLNQILDQAAFDGYVEALCQRFYAGALNLGSLMRRYSVGTPRGLQDRAAASLATLWSLLWHPETTATIIGTRFWLSAAPTDLDARHEPRGVGLLLVKAFTTGC